MNIAPPPPTGTFRHVTAGTEGVGAGQLSEGHLRATLPNVRKERLAVVGVARQGGDRPPTVQLLALLDVPVGQGSVQPHAGGLGLARTDGVGVQRRLDLRGVWG